MAKRKSTLITGMYQRADGIWHVDKLIDGQRLSKSTGERNERAAAAIAVDLIAEHKRSLREGIRPRRSFREAATRYLNEETKRSLSRDVQALKLLDPYIGHLDITKVHNGTVGRYIKERRQAGRSQSTINRDLAVVRRILTLAARRWRHPSGQSWLETVPLLDLPVDRDTRQPYPLSWAEERLFFPELPEHLGNMALFGIHTGCRQQEICQLRWDWEQTLPELGAGEHRIFVFMLPGERTKNGRGRIIILNRVARAVVNAQRGVHPTYVFTFDGHTVTRMLNGAWRRARERAAANYPARFGQEAPWGFAHIRVHDLRHTLGYRARVAGISHEDRQQILGHTNKSMTTHYSAADVGRLLDGLERVADLGQSPESAQRVVLRVS